ncbi:MAG: BON domain-containing protein [Acidobacteria bacterium]|nr:BON domain-containing protein [Acidobacteriota bacterium]
MNRVWRKVTMAAALLAAPALVQAAISVAPGKRASGLTPLENDIRHELVMLPWYGVFDHLEFQVDGGRLTLLGQVTRPTLKSDAERAVRRIEGVETVTNNIEVLPLSSFDDDVRLRVARAIFGDSILSRYAWGAVPPVHILVKNGDVTLKGVVDSESDKNVATLRANGVFGVFGVTNDLHVAK